MNERLKEFEKQATTVVEGWSDERGTTRHYEFNREKFAELIVGECVHIAYRNNNSGEGGVIADNIKEHFGVDGMSIEDKKTLIKELLGVKNETN